METLRPSDTGSSPDTGNDYVTGKKGDDILAGGTGSDVYIYDSGDGNDRVGDTGGTADTVRVYGKGAITGVTTSAGGLLI